MLLGKPRRGAGAAPAASGWRGTLRASDKFGNAGPWLEHEIRVVQPLREITVETAVAPTVTILRIFFSLIGYEKGSMKSERVLEFGTDE